MNAASALWARSILRRNWRATIFLTLFAGLGAGAVMAALEIARRTDTVVARRDAFLELPTLSLAVCSADFTPENATQTCSTVTGYDDVRQQLLAVAGVYRAAAGRFSALGLRKSGSGEHMLGGVNFNSIHIDGPVWGTGRPHIIGGRMPRPDAPDEIAISESWADALHLRAGDKVDMHAFTVDEYFAAASGAGVPDDAGVTNHVVGVVRVDVSPTPPGAGFAGVALTSDAWFGAQGPETMNFGPEYSVWATPEAADGLADRIAASFPQQHVEFSIGGFKQDSATLRAVGTQASATFVAALLALVAVALFLGQALMRQLLRELSDHASMRALGMPRTATVAALIRRTLPVSIAAAALAAATAVLGSTFGPLGLGRRAETELGIRFDPFVVVGGAVATCGYVLAVAVVVGAVIDRRRRPMAWTGLRIPGSSPTALAGRALSRSSTGRFAFGGALVSAAAGVAAIGASFVLLSSLNEVRLHPLRYGSPFDAVVSGGDETDGGHPDEMVAQAASSGIVRQASFLATVDNALPDGLDDEQIVGYDARIGGGIAPVVLEGRAPSGDSEIALGSVTMRRLGVHVGDSLDGVGANVGRDLGPMRIVGRVVVPAGDIAGNGLGRGAIVGPGDLSRLGGQPNFLVLILDPGVPQAQAFLTLRDLYGDAVQRPTVPKDIANLDRISITPKLLAAIILLFAAAALAHTLFMSVRRHRRDIGVVRALGLTRGQVSAAVAWQASAVAFAAAIVGLVTGVVAGRWGWQLIVQRMGIESAAHIPSPFVGALVVIIGALLFANAVAFIPGVRAARVNVVEALRAD